MLCRPFFVASLRRIAGKIVGVEAKTDPVRVTSLLLMTPALGGADGTCYLGRDVCAGKR